MRAVTRTLRAADGWRLSVLDIEPAGPARGVVIAGHAMMVDRRTLARDDRPCLAGALAAAGLRVLVPDLRGHGRSGPGAGEGADWSYDQLVEDTAVYVDLARALAPELPIATLGHSLFGHTALAWLARTPAAPVAAHVALAVDVWRPGDEDRPLHRLVKRAALRGLAGIVRRAGLAPVRRAGFGSADEAYSYIRDFTAWQTLGAWRARDGFDYGAGLARIACPVLHVLSEGDRLLASPRAAERLTAAAPRRELWRLPDAAPPALARLRPDHMGVVTDPASAPLWDAVATWLVRALPAATPAAAPC